MQRQTPLGFTQYKKQYGNRGYTTRELRDLADANMKSDGIVRTFKRVEDTEADDYEGILRDE